MSGDPAPASPGQTCQGKSHGAGVVAWVASLTVIRILVPDQDAGAPLWLLWHVAAVGTMAALLFFRYRGVGNEPTLGWRGVASGVAWLTAIGAVAQAFDPVAAWTLWAGWGGILLLTWLLVLVPKAIGPALMGVVALAGMLAIGQGLWGFPAMAQAIAVNDPRVAQVVVSEDVKRLLLERIHGGGWYGPFMLANALAVVMAMAVVMLTGSLWIHRKTLGTIAKIPVALAVLLTLAVILGAGAKGAVVALLVGAVWAAWWGWANHRRWIAVSIVALLGAGWWFSEVLSASVNVRLGYAQSAWRIAQEQPVTGAGLDGFARLYPGVMRPGDEPGTMVHNEFLAALVMGGWPLMVAVLVMVAVWVWPGRNRDVSTETDPAAPGRALLMTGLGTVLGVGVVGGLTGDGGVSWWPGAAEFAFGWVFLVGLGVGLAMWAGRSLTVPYLFANTALFLCVLTFCWDFHLHSPAVLVVLGLAGAAAAGAVLAGRAVIHGRSGLWLAGSFALVMAVAASHASNGHQERWLAQGADTAPSPAVLMRDPVLARDWLTRLTEDQAYLLAEHWANRPGSPPVWASLCSQQAARAGATRAAIAWARTAVARGPTLLPHHRQLVALLTHHGDHQEAAQAQAELDRLTPLVHINDRH